MSREIEIKLRLDHPGELRQRLENSGARLRAEYFEINRIFDTPTGGLRSSDRGLRLRTWRQLDPLEPHAPPAAGATLTYKGPRSDSPFKTRDEFETSVDDPARMAEILRRLGYVEAVRYEKLRELWELRGCEVCLDELPRLGWFTEVEAPDETTLRQVSAELCIDTTHASRQTYVELAAEAGATHGRLRSLRFERPSPAERRLLPRLPGWRRRLVERENMVRTQLEYRGIRSGPVLEAMRLLPREMFLSGQIAGEAYRDAALPVDCGQTISQPYIVARMTELLDLTPDDRVLEVGTGTGYQTAILAMLADHVYTIERCPELLAGARRRLAELGLTNVTCRCGDGSAGWAEYAPFDAIIVTAGAPQVPAALKDQLADGGRLVIPIGPLHSQMLTLVRRRDGAFEYDDVLPCRFVKLIGREGWNEGAAP